MRVLVSACAIVEIDTLDGWSSDDCNTQSDPSTNERHGFDSRTELHLQLTEDYDDLETVRRCLETKQQRLLSKDTAEGTYTFEVLSDDGHPPGCS